MSEDRDLIRLYSQRILALAAAIPLTERVANPDASAKVRSPLCGSTVSVELCLEGGRIVEFGQDVKACALGQAAASVLGANVIGKRRGDIELAHQQTRSMLKDGGEAPTPPFEDLGVLMPARDYKNRHASILLSLEATLAAYDKAAA